MYIFVVVFYTFWIDFIYYMTDLLVENEQKKGAKR